MSRQQLADEIDVSISTLANIENGGRRWRGEWVVPSPSDEILYAVAWGLGIDPPELFERTGREIPQRKLDLLFQRYWSKGVGMRRGSTDEEPTEMSALNGRILTPEERKQVEAYIDGLIAKRDNE